MSEKEPERIKVLTGFVKVTVETAMGIHPTLFRFTPTFVTIRDPGGNIVMQQSVPIGMAQVFPLTPGLFNISVRLANVQSEPQNVEVKAGEVTEIIVSFGK